MADSQVITTYSKDTPLAKINNFLFCEKIQNYLADAIKDKKDKFVSNLIALVSSNLDLQKCSPDSLMFACMKATALKLSLDQSLGQAYIVSYFDKKSRTDRAQFQIGWRGYMQLALRSGQVTSINVTDVREGELIEKNRQKDTYTFSWEQDDNVRNQLKVIGYTGYIELRNGFSKSIFMSMEQLQNHGKRYSQTFKKGYGVWVDDFCAMLKKTLYRYLLKNYALLSDDIIDAIASDQSVITESGLTYVDNPNNSSFSSEEKQEFVSALEGAFSESEVESDFAEEVNEIGSEDAISNFTKSDDSVEDLTFTDEKEGEMFNNNNAVPSALLD